MSAPRIPQELLDGILHELQSDTRTLQKCAVVARCFLPSSQRLIFSRIYLDTSGSGLISCQNLRTVLLRSPHLIEYAEALYLQLRPQTRNWNNQSNILADTLSMLSYLHSFRLSGSTAWSSLPDTHRHAIYRMFSLSSIYSVSVTGIRGFPLSIFTRCNQLMHIYINDVIVGLSVDPVPAIQDNLLPDSILPKAKGHLTTLSGGEGESGAIATRALVQCLVHPHSSLSLSALRHFTAAVRSDEDVTTYQTVIHSSRRSLESLSLSVDCKGESESLERIILTRFFSARSAGLDRYRTAVKFAPSIYNHLRESVFIGMVVTLAIWGFEHKHDPGSRYYCILL